MGQILLCLVYHSVIDIVRNRQ